MQFKLIGKLSFPIINSIAISFALEANIRDRVLSVSLISRQQLRVCLQTFANGLVNRLSIVLIMAINKVVSLVSGKYS